MKSYLKVQWHHDFPSEPVVLYSELDDGWEVRKVEVYRDGQAQKAGPDGATGDTQLSKTKFPTVDQISLDPQFEVEQITAAEFESQWISLERPAG